MNIQYRIKNVYGVERMYVANEAQSKLITKLTGQATLSQAHKSALEGLGFTFEQVL